MEKEILELLLDATSKLAEVNQAQKALAEDLKEKAKELEKHGKDIAVLEVSLKSVDRGLETEKKLNRDRQVDFSKLLDDKMENIYRMASIIAFIISLISSILLGILK
jgi:hypothetical protein